MVDWIDNAVGPALFLDHRRISPTCRSTKTEYCKFEMPENAPGLGMAPKLDS